MKEESVIGILGGMGPEATYDCFGKLIKNTPAGCDQEHLGIVIVNNPKVPDRTRAILENGPSPLPALHQGIDSLKRAGADFVIIPCVTAHYFLEELLAQCDLPVLSILDAVADHIRRSHPKMKTIGLLSTSGTVQSKIFQKRLAAEGIDTLVCSDPWQQQVMEAIYDIKNENVPRSQADIIDSLADAAAHLIRRGAQGIIAGCTEIPLALTPKDVATPYFDSLLILARAAIRRAGREPV
ncbi:MAG: amino acid racemase [Thermodesulfobacteriota bacterium]